MKKIIEWIKDVLYDSIDYIMMIGIIGAVALIICWRLDLLFAKDAADLPNNEIITENPKDVAHNDIESEEDNNINIPNTEDNTDNDKNNTNNDIENNPGDNINENTNENSSTTNDNKENQETEIVTVVIPPGSLPSKIASILEEHNLISNRAEFIQKTQELKLDTKLKSGTFQIKTNSSLEEIIRTIAN